jgi:protein-S-isoprenylcysteine O-methyltransferase Ste14
LTEFWLTFLAVVVYGALHSLMASEWVKGGARRLFGPASDRWYRLVFNLLGGLFFLPILIIVAANPGAVLYRLGTPWIFLTGAIQVLALITLAVGLMQTDALRFLGFRQLREPDQRRPSQLIVDGLYRWVRHPLYTAGLAFIWFTPWMSTSILALNLGLTAYILIGSEFEERRLRLEFGQSYVDYQARVPRLLPRPWRHGQG